MAKLFTELGSPGKNAHLEPLSGKLRYKPASGEILYTRGEAQVLVEQWRRHCRHEQPHRALVYRPPAPAAREPSVLA